MKTMTPHYSRIDREVEKLVEQAIKANGVPADIDGALRLSTLLYDEVLSARTYLISREAYEIAHDFSDMVIPPIPQYKQAYLDKLVMRTAGLAPDTPMKWVEHTDPVTRERAKIPTKLFAMPDDNMVIQRFTEDLAAGVARHAKAASRDLVVNTAIYNRVGWARQMTGAETCAFCAMLVSRGAVYSDKTAHFQSHNNCDCTATLVRKKGDDYPGRDVAAELRQLWEYSGDLNKFGKLLEQENIYEKVAA